MISTLFRNRFLYLIQKKAVGSIDSSLQRFFSASAVPELKIRKNADSIALYLKEEGFSEAQVEKVLKFGKMPVANLEKTIKPKINIFQEFGFSSSEIAEIITRAPSILVSIATKRVYASLSTLLSLIASHSKAVTVLRRGIWFMTSDLSKTLCPNIEFLKNRGVSMKRILHLLDYSPTAAFLRPRLLRKHVEKLESLGMNPSSGIFVHGIWAVSSMSDQVWELKLQTFMDLGFTQSETLAMFMKSPLVFTVSVEKIKRNVETLLATGIYKRSSIIIYPMSLVFSSEKRLRPRIRVMEILENQKLIEKWPRLHVVCSYTDEQFHEEYVYPYLNEFGHLLSTVDGISVVK